MKSARAVAQEVHFSERIDDRADQVSDVRTNRNQGSQDVAFGARPFILCGVPIRPLPEGVLTYRRQNGKFCLEITDHPDWGVPFGQDRLVLLYLATQAVRFQTRNVHFRSGAELLVEWGMPTNDAHYKRLAHALPLFGLYGLANQLGVQTFTRERKFRERIHSWLKLVHLYWPECPALVSRNGMFLEVNRASAILPREAQSRYQAVTSIVGV